MRSSDGVLLGEQTPRLSWLPPARVSSAGEDAVALAESAGLLLDPWQQLVLQGALSEDVRGRWAAFQVLLIVARQNGKGGVLEARELCELFLFPKREVIHSAHEFRTALSAFNRLVELIDNAPHLRRKVKRIDWSHGKEGIELLNGSSIRFRTRTEASGRGLQSDLLMLDEAMILKAAMMATLVPTMATRFNPQIWYVGTAVDQRVHQHGQVMTKVRRQGQSGKAQRLAYFEWSAPGDSPADRKIDLDDRALWAMANPAAGIRIDEQFIDDERTALDDRGFAVERLGIGDWPSLEDEAARLFDVDQWMGLADSAPELPTTRRIGLALEMTRDRRTVLIGAAVFTAAGKVHVELGWHEAPSQAVVPTVVELVNRWDPVALVIDSGSPAKTYVQSLADVGIEATVTNAGQMAEACGGLFDDVGLGQLSQTGDPLLLDDVKVAEPRKLGDRFAFTERGPLSTVALARWGLLNAEPVRKGPPQTPVTEIESPGTQPVDDGLMAAGF